MIDILNQTWKFDQKHVKITLNFNHDTYRIRSLMNKLHNLSKNKPSKQYINIIWDLGGTLFRANPALLTAEEQKTFSFILYMWAGKAKRADIDQLAFDIFQDMGAQEGPESEIMRLHTGVPVPRIISDYLSGKVSGEEAIECVSCFLDEWGKRNKAVAKEMLNLIKENLITFFTPSSLVKCISPIPQAIKLLKSMGRNEHHHFILSNWDHASFSLLYERYKDTVFPYFDKKNIAISGDIGYVKPQRALYSYFLNHYKLEPETCLFIDDQPENIITAESFGIQGVLFNQENTKPILQLLKKLKS